MASAGVTAPRGSCFQQWLILGGKSLRAGQACSGASHEYFSCPAVLAVRIPASGIPVMCSSQQLACCQHRCVPLAAGISPAYLLIVLESHNIVQDGMVKWDFLCLFDYLLGKRIT